MHADILCTFKIAHCQLLRCVPLFKRLVLTKENVKDTGYIKGLSQLTRSILVHVSCYPLYLHVFPGGFPLLYAWTMWIL